MKAPQIKSKPKPYSALGAAPDWTLMMYTYKRQHKIPGHVGVSSSRLVLLTGLVPVFKTSEGHNNCGAYCETNIPRDHTFKLNKYYDLTNELSTNKFCS